MNLFRWLARKLEPYIIIDLQAGGHCSFCGKWVPHELCHRDWAWVLCEQCLKKYNQLSSDDDGASTRTFG